jgi:hypothetical protein
MDSSTSRIEAPKLIKWFQGTESVGSIVKHGTFIASSLWVHRQEPCRFRIHVQHKRLNKIDKDHSITNTLVKEMKWLFVIYE